MYNYCDVKKHYSNNLLIFLNKFHNDTYSVKKIHILH
jgi:hypothetical protein